MRWHGRRRRAPSNSIRRFGALGRNGGTSGRCTALAAATLGGLYTVMEAAAGTGEADEREDDQEHDESATKHGRFRRAAGDIAILPSGDGTCAIVEPRAIPFVSFVATARSVADGVRVPAVEARCPALVPARVLAVTVAAIAFAGGRDVGQRAK